MIGRGLLKYFGVGLLAWSLVGGSAVSAWCQERQPVAQPKPPQQQDRAGLANPLLQVEKVSPELEKVLKDWENSSKTIQSLQGKHQRFVYDLVFEVEKRADGAFYYEAPDKGRIDISAAKILPGMVSRKVGKDGKPFKLQSDRPERWISTGQEIMQINDQEKTVEIFPIPPDAQGENIMEGPLPFLFGMPAEKAKRRYMLTLKSQNDNQIHLQVKPRWQQDAANWKEAEVILRKDTYLPSAVKLVDPSGNLDTVYSFSDLETNQKGKRPQFIQRIWPIKDPFKPDLGGYKMVKANPAPAAVPDVVGLDWKEAKARLNAAGFEVKFIKGMPAPRDELVFTVYDQQPIPTQPPPKGEPISLTLYLKAEERKAEVRTGSNR